MSGLADFLSRNLSSTWVDGRFDTASLPAIRVARKSDVTERLYRGRCPIESELPLEDGLVPHDGHPFRMREADIDLIVSKAGAKPHSFLEIGTFHGDTAVMVARHLKIPVICIDTWLGDLAMWTNYAPGGFLLGGKSVPAAPRFYRRFCANVVSSQVLDRVTCLRLPSQLALKLLRLKKLAFDAIYVDGSHDYLDVLMDIHLSHEVLHEGGLLFGDDYHLPNVRRAVDDYCEATGESLETFATEVHVKAKDVTIERHYWMIRPRSAPAA